MPNLASQACAVERAFSGINAAVRFGVELFELLTELAELVLELSEVTRNGVVHVDLVEVFVPDAVEPYDPRGNAYRGGVRRNLAQNNRARQDRTIEKAYKEAWMRKRGAGD